jgi:Arc/MetJ-type ribon-helix-helix transcriptional regulator
MMEGMTAKKVAITVPEQTLERARSAVKAGRAASLSAYVSRALEQQSMLDDLDALLEEMLEETGGPLTTAEKRWADAALRSPKNGPRQTGRKARR